jgi:hypothetical protein
MENIANISAKNVAKGEITLNDVQDKIIIIQTFGQ